MQNRGLDTVSIGCQYNIAIFTLPDSSSPGGLGAAVARGLLFPLSGPVKSSFPVVRVLRYSLQVLLLLLLLLMLVEIIMMIITFPPD